MTYTKHTADKRETKVSTLSGKSNNRDFGRDTGRISNALSSNIAIRKQLNLFDGIGDEDKERLLLSDQTNYVDRKGKTISLSVEDIQLIKALSSYIPFHDPEVQDYIKAVNTMDANGVPKQSPKSPLQIPISILQLSKDIIGDTKETSLKKIGDRLQRLESIEQAQTFLINGEKYMLVRPLIRFQEKIYKCYSEVRSSRGRKKDPTPDGKEKKILVGANVIYSSLFMYEATNKFCPIYSQRLFDVWRGNKTELFAILLSDLESKWRQYYINSIKAEATAREKNKDLLSTNKSEYYRLIAEAKSKALIYKSSTTSVRDRVTTDYETNRTQRSRFIPDLQRAVNSLIEYGIITDKSNISKDSSNVYFCFNPHFAPKEDLPLFPNEPVERDKVSN